ncbi:MAG: holin [Actinomyces sp.]|uniref:holin n=1 Tax=Actinomyces sp. TaxID=29317 RepID=UPI0026DD84E0|nr:holin [Actinomyces sp.]MDO4243814.1 holin [Actinomyces sp.]
MTAYTKTWAAGAAERALKTAAQTLAALVVPGAVIWELDWAQALGVTATAAVLSVLTSVADPRHADTAIATATEG